MISLLALALMAVATPEPVDDAALAIAGGMTAEEKGDAAAMLEAARALDALGARAGPEEEDLAVRWRALARERGLADEQPLRGRALGPAYKKGVLAPGAALATEQVFLAGQGAEVALVPGAGGALSMKVTARGKPICERAAEPPRATCSWLPIFTERVGISVENRGSRPAAYYLVSN